MTTSLLSLTVLQGHFCNLRKVGEIAKANLIQAPAAELQHRPICTGNFQGEIQIRKLREVFKVFFLWVKSPNFFIKSNV